LKDPAKSLPQGTLLAIATGFTTYLIMIFWFALSASRADLMGADIVAVKMAKSPFMVITGIWAATLSSALASIMAAPRTLQAMARDGVVFRFLAGKREDSGPFVSMLVTIAIASFIVFLGNLNMIAPILTNFFLITYGSINLIAGLERFFSLPSYRPTFHVHWFFSLLGFAGCIIVMFILNPVACIVGFLLVFLIYVYLKRKHFVATFGDARHGFWYGVIHYALNKLESLPFSPKNWRPNLLMFSNDTKVNQNIIQIATSLSGRTGTVTLINFLNPEKVEVTEAKRIEAEISEAFHQAKVPAYFLTALSDDGVEAQLVTSQVYGMGRFRPNTILLNWNESKKKWFGVDKSEKKKQMKLMSFYNEIGKSLLLLHVDDSKGFGNKKHIDVWWDPSHDNGSFMLLIAYLLTLSEEWEDAMIHIKTVVVKKKVTSTGKILKQLLENARIEATINVYHPDSRDEEASVSTVVTSTNLELFVSKVGRSFNLIKDKINLYSFTRTTQDVGVDKLKDEKVISTEKSQGVILKETLEKQMTEEEIDFIEDCVSSIIARESSGVDLVILGFNPPAHGREREYVDKMDNILANLPSVLLVHSSFDMDIYG
ncbi:MAG: hypothetical protein PHF25_09010, partial [Candidatus Margulisbacteria bacterium]|nr:hypothetical protein [Candidatus Margulisiibacteriota bacterium]